MAVNLNREYKRLAKILEDGFKKEIKKQGLIDTGELFNTFSVSVDLKRDNQVFKIEANEYFQYLDKQYSITDNVMKSSDYRKFENELTKLYNLIVEEALGAK